MPHLNHTGPEGEGPGTGRKIGKCKNAEEVKPEDLGKGLGLKRKSGGGKGKGKRLKSSKIFDNQNKIKDENCHSNQE